MTFDNALDPFLNFLCSYRPKDDGFVIDGIYHRSIEDYVEVAYLKTNYYGYHVASENEYYNDDIFTSQERSLRRLYVAYLINHEYEYDKLKEAFEAFEENQDILEYMFNWLRQDYEPTGAFFSFSKYLSALRDWGYKSSSTPSSEQETDRILDESYPVTMTIDTDEIDKDMLAKILGEQTLSFVKEVKEAESECTMCLKIHKTVKEEPTSNGAYWCACADVMDGNVGETCFWREVTFVNGVWCVDDGTLVLAWMALPPSQNPKDFF